jgi:penicillin-binding protein 1B
MPIEVRSIHERRRPRIIKSVGRVVKHGAQAAALRKRRLMLQAIAAAPVVALIAIVAFLIFSYISYSRIVDARLSNGYLTSRAGIYAAPRTLRVGQTIERDRLVELLRRAGYVESDASDVWSGGFTVRENVLEIRPRHIADTTNVPQIVRVQFDKKHRIAQLTGEGVPLDSYTLEPELLTTDAGMKTGQHAQLAYKDIPKILVQAILSIEDRRFFEHRGLDFFGIARAALRNAGDSSIGQGGSTITQQLVKNTYLSPERTLRRKYAEAMLAFTLERRLSKEDIFALYANEIYLGQRGAIGVRGVEQAARLYFGKELKDLSLSEAATIAGMIQSPNRYAPDRHPEASKVRRNTVLAAMARDGVITNEQAGVAAKETPALAPLKETENSLAPYFVDYVNRVVESRVEAGAVEDERSLRVYTTIDLDLQQLAETTIRSQLERLDKVYKGRKGTPEAALVALDPKTGHVLAMVGGRNYAVSQLNRATDARRQPGSVFKPIVYAAALESGLSPLSLYADEPREFIYDRRSKYKPANYGDTYSMHDVTMRTGLIKSLNVVTVDVAMRTGLERVARMADGFGLPKPEAYPALALGTTEATPLEVAAAYAAFANGGQRVKPTVIALATDASDITLMNAGSSHTSQVVKPTTAYMMTDMLAGVIDHGTARAARGAVRKTALAGKTGTSRDGWFVGYTPNLVCAVWIGFDDNKQLGMTGAEAALPAWTEFVKGAVELRPDLGGEQFARPAGITTVEIDPETGLRATGYCPQRERIAITSNFVSSLECTLHNETFELEASADISDFYDDAGANDYAETYSADAPVRDESKSASRVARSSERVLIEVEDASSGRRHIEQSTRSRTTLVNEMRLKP